MFILSVSPFRYRRISVLIAIPRAGRGPLPAPDGAARGLAANRASATSRNAADALRTTVSSSLVKPPLLWLNDDGGLRKLSTTSRDDTLPLMEIWRCRQER